MQKKNLFSFHFRVHSNFAVEGRRVTQKQEKIFNILYDSATLTYWTLDNWTIGQN